MDAQLEAKEVKGEQVKHPVLRAYPLDNGSMFDFIRPEPPAQTPENPPQPLLSTLMQAHELPQVVVDCAVLAMVGWMLSQCLSAAVGTSLEA